MAAIQNFHAHHVSHGLASWELTPPDVEEPTARRDGGPSGGYPYLVAMQEEQLVGHVSAGPHRFRPAYLFTVESTVYLPPVIKAKAPPGLCCKG